LGDWHLNFTDTYTGAIKESVVLLPKVTTWNFIQLCLVFWFRCLP